MSYFWKIKCAMLGYTPIEAIVTGRCVGEAKGQAVLLFEHENDIAVEPGSTLEQRVKFYGPTARRAGKRE